MEFLHPFKARREKKTQQQVLKITSWVSAQIVDHLSENGDVELRIPVGEPPRKVAPPDFLGAIAAQASETLATRTPQFANHLVYDDVASRRASMHVVKTQVAEGEILSGGTDWYEEINAAGLTMVLVPAHQQADSQQV